MRRLRWLFGGIILAGCFVAIFLVPVQSLLGWQSAFLARAFLILVLSSSLALWRVIVGPTAPDRVVAIDILGILIIGFCALLGIPTGRDWYIDIGIAWSLQSFISILALGKYLEGKNFDE